MFIHLKLNKRRKHSKILLFPIVFSILLIPYFHVVHKNYLLFQTLPILLYLIQFLLILLKFLLYLLYLIYPHILLSRHQFKHSFLLSLFQQTNNLLSYHINNRRPHLSEYKFIILARKQAYPKGKKTLLNMGLILYCLCRLKRELFCRM